MSDLPGNPGEKMIVSQFRNLVFEGGGVLNKYPVKLFDRET